MNRSLAIVNSWYHSNKLILNINKTMYVTFGNRNDSLPQNLTIHLDNHLLNRVQSTSYMGVIFDQNIKWKEHVKSIYKRTRYLIYIFSRLKNILSFNNLISAYFAFFHSIATYGIIAWGSAYGNSKNLLLNLQEKLYNIVRNKNSKNNSILNINQTYIYKSIISEYQCLKDKYLNSNSKTRNKNLIFPEIRLNIGKMNHIFTATKIYNKLPHILKTLDIKKKSSKKIIKEWILKSGVQL